MHHWEARYCLCSYLLLAYLKSHSAFLTLQYHCTTKKALQTTRQCRFQCFFFAVQGNFFVKSMAEPLRRPGEWMTWGKMAREALQACAQKCRLILHFDTLCPSASLLQAPFIYLLPTVLVTEHFEKTMRARCQRPLCMLNEEPPSTSSPVHSFWIKPSLIGPFMQQGPLHQFSGRSGSAVNSRGTPGKG